MRYWLRALDRTFYYRGRASRKEYWMFVLCHSLIGFTLFISGIIAESGGLLITASVYGYIGILPTTSAAVRRLHDFGASGWWVLPISFIPIPGVLFLIRRGDDGENNYGPESSV